ncbi:MAG: type II toxin-antitoxin system VapC family toxin [Methanomassiliicoccaceae archaeon]|nr:type II toxin-antitoxin system VapC family toxin [Methanomassiliicoccaceae archaeon]
MTYYLDSNIPIFVLRGMNKRLAEKIDSFCDDEIKIPSVVVAELMEGAYASDNTQHNIEQTLRFIGPYEAVPFDKEAAIICGKISADLTKKGRKIGYNDLMIAATVISRNGILVTNNSKDFGRIEGLRSEDWT